MKKPWLPILLHALAFGLGLLISHVESQAADASQIPPSDSTPEPELADVAASGAGN